MQLDLFRIKFKVVMVIYHIETFTEDIWNSFFKEFGKWILDYTTILLALVSKNCENLIVKIFFKVWEKRIILKFNYHISFCLHCTLKLKKSVQESPFKKIFVENNCFHKVCQYSLFQIPHCSMLFEEVFWFPKN